MAELSEDDARFVSNIVARVQASEEKDLDPFDFDYLFTDDVTAEEADRYFEILDSQKGTIT